MQHASGVNKGIPSLCVHEISVNGRLHYHSGEKKRDSARKDNPGGSEGVEKDAIRGYLIYYVDDNT
jgi:hypothetical protein